MVNMKVGLAVGLAMGVAQACMARADFVPCVPGMLENARDELVRQGYEQVRVGFRSLTDGRLEVAYSYRQSMPAGLFGFGQKHFFYAGTDVYDAGCHQQEGPHPVRVSDDPTGGRE